MPKHSGFTLIEILISIAIISLAGVFVLPNLGKFNTGQQVLNVASELKTVLKNASSRTASNIKCNNTNASSAWQVIINKTTPVSFSLEAVCDNNNIVRHYSSAITQNVSIASSSCTSYPVTLTFMPSEFSYTCQGLSSVKADFSITLTDSQDSTQKTTITITKGGIISESQ